MNYINDHIQLFGGRFTIGWRVPVVSVLPAIALVAFLMFGVESGYAEILASPPTVEPCEARQIHASRTELIANGKSGLQVHYHFEYAQSESGPWTATENGTVNPHDGNLISVRAEVHHLVPATAYYARIFMENESGQALKVCTFKTSPVEPPEVSPVQIRQLNADTSVGTKYVDLETVIQSNGRETKYQFEYSTNELGPYVATPGEGTSGTVTAAEDFVETKAHITGLTPNTLYYIHVVATSTIGEAKNSRSIRTAPEYPEASIRSMASVGATSAVVQAAVRSRSLETKWALEYATSLVALQENLGVVGFEGTITAAESSEGFTQVEGELTGLTAGTIYYVRIHAVNGREPAAISTPPRTFETAGQPVVQTFATHAYTPGDETIRVVGSVQPRGYDTHYAVEYIAQEDYESSGWATAGSTPEQDAGVGGFVEPQGFPVTIIGVNLPNLQTGKQYRYRLVAFSVQGSAKGTEQSLTVPASMDTGSPACSNSSLRNGASADLPDCRAYEQVTPSDKAGSMDNWTYSGNVSTPVLVGEDGNHVMVRPQFSKWGQSPDATNSSYFFSRQENTGWLMTSTTPQPQAAGNSYRPEIFSPNLTHIGLGVDWSTGVVNASHSIELLEGVPGGPYTLAISAARSSSPAWVAASPDLQVMVFSSAGNLFEWSHGEVNQINGSCPATVASDANGGAPGGSVSEGGSRIFFEAASGAGCAGPRHLYAYESNELTVDIGAYKFLAANAQGSTLLLEKVGARREYLLFDTASMTTKPVIAANEQLQPVASRDMSVIYVGSKERIGSEAPLLATGSEFAAAPEDIYRYESGSEELRFVIQASGLAEGSTSPEGRYFYFQATGVAGIFRGVDPGASGENSQVYRYDSGEDVVECMSCASSFNPNPQRSATFTKEEIEKASDNVPRLTIASDNGDYVFFDTVAALVRQDIDGEVHPCVGESCDEFDESGNHDFFYSVSSDVYEWRKNGIDDCSKLQGCLTLISSGIGGLKNVLLGATPSGKDVFFATHSQLVGQDTDNQGDVYDARIGGGFPTPQRGLPECEGDACTTPIEAPIDATPASLSFSGQTDPGLAVLSGGKTKVKAKSCKKGTIRSKGRCVKRKSAKAVRIRRISRHKSRSRK